MTFGRVLAVAALEDEGFTVVGVAEESMASPDAGSPLYYITPLEA